MAYTDPNATFIVREDRHMGFGVVGGVVIPVILTTIGGALFRALFENGGGLTANELGFTHGTTNVVPTGFRTTRGPAIWQGEINFIVHNASIDPADDVLFYEDVIVFDPAFNPASPTISSPTLKEWADALGGVGSYTEASP